jgi:hypothetical protein
MKRTPEYVESQREAAEPGLFSKPVEFDGFKGRVTGTRDHRRSRSKKEMIR